MLSPHYENDIIPVVLKKPDHYRTLAMALEAGHYFTDVKGSTYPADPDRIGDSRCETFHLIDLIPVQTAYNAVSVWNVLPGPVAHAAADSACCRIRLISAAAARRSARSGDSATIRSQARNRAASSGHRSTDTQLNQCSTK